MYFLTLQTLLFQELSTLSADRRLLHDLAKLFQNGNIIQSVHIYRMFLRNGSFRPLTDKIGKTKVGEKYSTIHLYFFPFTSEQRYHCNYDQSLSLLLLFQFLIQKITRLQNIHEIFAQFAEEEKNARITVHQTKAYKTWKESRKSKEEKNTTHRKQESTE